MKRILLVGMHILVAVTLCIAACLHGGDAAAQQLKLRVNGAEKSGATLEAAFAAQKLQEVTSISIYEGSIAAADWTWMYAHREEWSSLKTFEVTAGITSVADLATSSTPLGSTVEMVTIHKLQTVKDAALRDMSSAIVLSLPDVTELGKEALADNYALQVLQCAKLAKVGESAFSGCGQLSMLALGATPPTMPIDEQGAPDPFDGLPTVRALMLMKGDAPLEGDELKTAQAAYWAVKDGNVKDSMWLDWPMGSFWKMELDGSMQHGSVKLTPYPYAIAGRKVIATFSPDLGWALKEASFTPKGGNKTLIESDRFTMPKAPITVTAEFYEKVLKVKITKLSKETVTKQGASLSEIFKDLELNTIAELNVLEGRFDRGDWILLKSNRGELYKLRKFTIENTVMSADDIPDNADYEGIFAPGNLGSIEEIVLHKVKRVGSYAFINCSKLKKAELPDATELALEAFNGTESLEDFEAPKLVSIGKSCFDGCIRLKSAEFEHLETLERDAFSGAKSLVKVVLGKVTKLKTHAFSQCISLVEVIAPQVTELEQAVFWDGEFNPCQSLKSVYMPNVKSIGERAFYQCSALRQIVVGTAAPQVGNEAFGGCKSVDVLLIAKADGTILTTAADLEAPAATYKAAEDGNTQDELWYGWKIPTGNLYKLTADPNIEHGALEFIPAVYAPAGREVKVIYRPALGYLVAGSRFTPEGGEAQDIADGKFVMPDKNVVVSVTYTQNKLEISVNGNETISGYSLEDLLHEFAGNYSKVESIKVISGTFPTQEWEWLSSKSRELSGLSSFEIAAEGVTASDVPDVENVSVFPGYFHKTALKKADLQGVRRIGAYAFGELKALTEVNLPNATHIGHDAFYECRTLTKVEIPEVTELGNSAFSNCFGIQSLDLPKVTRIGDGVFFCQDSPLASTPMRSSLTGVTTPLVEHVGEDAFNACVNLQTVDIPNLRTLGKSAFSSCMKLNNVEFEHIEEIAPAAFYRCSKLTKFRFPKATRVGAGAFAWAGLVAVEDDMLPEVTTVEESAFKNNEYRLRRVRMSKAEKLGVGSFSNCYGLEWAYFPSMKTIDSLTFVNDSVLREVIMPRVSSVGKKAFFNCKELVRLSLGAQPPAVAGGEETFKRDCTANDCGERVLLLVDEKGERLTGEALEAAKAAYLASPGGKAAENTWYGWKLNVDVFTVRMDPAVKNGSFACVPTSRTPGEKCIIEARANEGYQLVKGSIKAYKADDPSAEVKIVRNSITMPAHDVLLFAEFEAKRYAIQLAAMEHGTVTVVDSASLGTTVELTAKPEAGYELEPESLKVYKAGAPSELIALKDGNKFEMPGYNVEVVASFKKAATPEPKPEPKPAPKTAVEDMPLSDVQVAPNPFADHVQVMGAESVQNFWLLDVSGRVISTGAHDGSSELRITTSHLQSGLYLLRLRSAHGERAIRLIKR